MSTSVNDIKTALWEVLFEPEVKRDLLSGLNNRMDILEMDIQNVRSTSDRKIEDLSSSVKNMESLVNKQEQASPIPRVIITGLEAHITKDSQRT